MTHFLHLYDETIGLDVLEGSFQRWRINSFSSTLYSPPSPTTPHPTQGCVYGEWTQRMREGVEMGQPLRWPWRREALWLEHPPVLGVPRAFLRWRGAWQRKGRRLVIRLVC